MIVCELKPELVLHAGQLGVGERRRNLDTSQVSPAGAWLQRLATYHRQAPRLVS
jgi:hypothetical protein